MISYFNSLFSAMRTLIWLLSFDICKLVSSLLSLSFEVISYLYLSYCDSFALLLCSVLSNLYFNWCTCSSLSLHIDYKLSLSCVNCWIYAFKRETLLSISILT